MQINNTVWGSTMISLLILPCAQYVPRELYCLQERKSCRLQLRHKLKACASHILKNQMLAHLCSGLCHGLSQPNAKCWFDHDFGHHSDCHHIAVFGFIATHLEEGELMQDIVSSVM